MSRTREFNRDMRARKIAHRKYVDKERNRAYADYTPWYSEDGYYNKGKIHCSCGMCSRYSKTNNRGGHRRIRGNYAPSKNWSHSDRLKLESLESQAFDYANA